MAQGLKSNILQEAVLEIASELRGIIGKAANGLLASGHITLPIDGNWSTTSQQVQDMINKVLQCATGNGFEYKFNCAASVLYRCLNNCCSSL